MFTVGNAAAQIHAALHDLVVRDRLAMHLNLSPAKARKRSLPQPTDNMVHMAYRLVEVIAPDPVSRMHHLEGLNPTLLRKLKSHLPSAMLIETHEMHSTVKATRRSGPVVAQDQRMMEMTTIWVIGDARQKVLGKVLLEAQVVVGGVARTKSLLITVTTESIGAMTASTGKTSAILIANNVVEEVVTRKSMHIGSAPRETTLPSRKPS